MKWLWIVIVLLMLAAGAVLYYYPPLQLLVFGPQDFVSCITSNSPVIPHTYPRQCEVRGRIFTEVLPTDTVPGPEIAFFNDFSKPVSSPLTVDATVRASWLGSSTLSLVIKDNKGVTLASVSAKLGTENGGYIAAQGLLLFAATSGSTGILSLSKQNTPSIDVPLKFQ